MTIFRTVLILITGFIAAVFIGGVIVGPEWRAEAKTSLPNVSAATVRATVFDLKTWPQWAPLNGQLQPQIKRAYSNVTTGKDAAMTWSDGVINSTITITSVSNERMDYMVDMQQLSGGDWTSQKACYFIVQPTGNDADLTWGCWGNAGSNPVTRLIARWSIPAETKNLASGLANLKAQFSR